MSVDLRQNPEVAELARRTAEFVRAQAVPKEKRHRVVRQNLDAVTDLT
ncbi:hypothetical protein [Frankia sp. Cr2]|nr:hypothetical protein [Frankia sp. Cr2]